MRFTFRPMDEAAARAIVGWRYEPPYSFYNSGSGTPEEDVRPFLNPDYAYYSMTGEDEELVGYCCFGEDARVPGGRYDQDALDVGGGMKPDLTGRGGGLEFLNAILDFGRRQYSPARFRVTVAAFNQRSIRLCQKAGFHPAHSFVRGTGPDAHEFVQLVREA